MEMDAHAATFDADALLKQREAIRRLALHLVRDAEQAEDIAQDAMLIRLQAGHRARGLPAWLAGVTRNLAARQGRDASRRRQREERVARAEQVPPTDDVAAKLAEHRRLLDVLESLDVPYRQTLLMRYFEGLPPRAIAKRTSTPVATVKSRLQRGLKQMRTRMDGEHDGDRRRWMTALLPTAIEAGLAPAAGWGALAGGSVWMSTKTKFLAGAAALLLLSGGLWFALDDEDAPFEARPENPDRAAEVPEEKDKRAPGTLVGSPAAAKRPEEPAAPTHFTGRVVDAARVAVANATVRVLDEGKEQGRTATDDRGRFSLDLVVPKSEDLWEYKTLVVTAHAPDGQVGYGHGYDARTSESRVQTIVVRPAHKLVAQVVTSDGAAVPAATVRVRHRQTNTRPAELQARRTDVTGRVVLDGLPPGACSLCAIAPGCAPGIASTRLPHDGSPVVIRLDTRRTFAATVLERGTNAAVPDVAVSTTAHAAPGPLTAHAAPGPFWTSQDMGWTATTDRQGVAEVPTFSDGARVSARAHAPRRPNPHAMNRDHPSAAEVKDGAVTLYVDAPTRLSWPIADGQVDRPEEGAHVEIRDASSVLDLGGFEVPSAGRIEKGHVVVDNGMPTPNVGLQLLAILEDGRGALLSLPKGGGHRGDPVTFEEMRTVDVEVVEADGTPARDMWVGVADGQPQQLKRYLRARTDAQGRCRLTRLLAQVTTIRASSWVRVLDSGKHTVDLTAASQQVRIQLPALQRGHVIVEIDGKPALPPSYYLWIQDPQTGARLSDMVDEDGARGRATFELRADRNLEGLPIGIVADGYPRASAVLTRQGSTVSATLVMERRDGLEVAVQPPADGRFDLVLEKYANEYRRWYGSTRLIPEQRGQVRLRKTMLQPGRYRVRDLLTGVTSPAVEVTRGGGPREVALDLSASAPVAGRVDTPAGFDPAFARVIVHRDGRPQQAPPAPTAVPVFGAGAAQVPAGPPFAEPAGAIRLRSDGSFTVRIADAAIELQAWHPLLRGQRIVVDRDQPGITLVLREGPTATFRLGADATRGAGRRIRLLDDEGQVVFETSPMKREDALVFGGFEPGTYTVRIDGGERTPFIRRGVELGEGETKLGEVRFSAGSSVRVRFSAPAGAKLPFVRLRAEPSGGGKIRSTITRPTSARPAVLQGLPAGRWRFMVRNMAGAKILYDEEVDVNGTDDIEVTVALE